MAKDRAAPFSKKHRRYWLSVLGGMIVIGIFNVALGMCAWPGADKVYRTPERIIPVLPKVQRDGATNVVDQDASLLPTTPVGPGAPAPSLEPR